MRMTAFLTAGLVLALPAAGQAQKSCEAEFRTPAKGSWVEYRMTSTEKNASGNLRYAILGEEAREGQTMTWLEMKMSGMGEQKGEMIMQVLVPSYPFNPTGIQEMVMKVPGQPAMKMSGRMMGMMRGQMQNNPGMSVQDMCSGVEFVGNETVTVPAGTFRTRHYHSAEQNSDAWIVENQPFGMVKASGPRFTIEMTGTGTGATSSITETPREMPGM